VVWFNKKYCEQRVFLFANDFNHPLLSLCFNMENFLCGSREKESNRGIIGAVR
jgi:hypothetical protein